MPVVINEVEISVTVDDHNTPVSATSPDSLPREEIIKECVEQVMAILNQKNER